MKISDFKPNDKWNFRVDGLQILDASGGTAVFEYDEEEYDAIFTYVTKENMKACPADGWYHQEALEDGEWISIDDAGFDDISYGFGWVYETSSNEAGLIYSGQVAEGPQTIVAANSGWNVIGNPTPVFADYKDITVNSDWNFRVDGLQILDASGGTATFEYDEEEYDAIFTYVTKENMKACPADGWYHQEALEDGEWISIDEAGWSGLEAGEAVVFETSKNTAGIQFPGAIDK